MKQWQAFFDITNQKTIEDLTILMQVSEKKMLLKSICKNITDAKCWPVSNNTLQLYQDAINKSRQLLNETKFDQDIESFLKKVSDKKATLSDLTPSILSWLEAENLKEKISLSIRI